MTVTHREVSKAIKIHHFKSCSHSETDQQISLAILAVEDSFDESGRYFEEFLGSVAEKKMWADALPVINQSLNVLDTVRKNGAKNLDAAKMAVDSKINPTPRRSEIRELLDFQRQAEARQILSGLNQADKLKAIDKALENSDRSLLDAALAAPVITDKIEQRLLEERKTSYEEQLSSRVCQDEFQMLQAVKKLNEKLEASLATAKHAIYAIANGKWSTISTSLRDELLSNSSSRNILQRAGLNVLQ